MAVLPFDLTDEERRRQEEEAAAGGQPGAGSVVGAPQGSPGGAPAGGDAPAGGSPQSQGTSGWTDINAYLNANQEQAVDTANKVAGRLGEQATDVRGAIDTAKTGFKQKVDESTINEDNDVVSRASADPLAFSSNADDVAKFKKMRDAQYGGPTSFQDADDYTTLLQKIDEANQKAKGVDTEAGREALLAGIMTNPTKGMTSLDNLLIGQNPNARQKLTDAAKPFAELSGYLDTATGEATGYATEGRNKTSDTATATKAALDATRGRLDTDLTNKLAATKTEATTKSQAAMDKLKNYLTQGGNLTQEDMDIMGITPAQQSELLNTIYTLKHAGDFNVTPNTPKGQLNEWWKYGSPDFYNVDFDPSNFANMQSPDAQITRANASTPEDYARIAALEDLMGGESGLLNQNDVGQAGTASRDLLDFRGGEAVTNSKEALKQKDRERASTMAASYSGGLPGAPGSDEQLSYMANSNKPFWDAVMTGRTQYHSSNPEANARGLALIRAFARLGFYTPPPNSILNDPGMRSEGAFINPEGA